MRTININWLTLFSGIGNAFTRSGYKPTMKFTKLLTACFVLMCSLLSNVSFSQDCPSLNCTSNAVQVTRVFLADANGNDLSSNYEVGDPVSAYLWIVVSTNTQRLGVFISGTLKVAGQPDQFVGECFSANLNGNANLIKGPQVTWSYGSAINLENIFIAWGTGNDDYCAASFTCNAANPAQCSRQGNIAVEAPLVASFSDNSECVSNNLFAKINLASTTYGGTSPYSFVWEYWNGASWSSLGTNSTASYQPTSAASVTIRLTVTDSKSPTAVVDSETRVIAVQSCCQASTAPTSINVSNNNFCVGGSTTLTVNGGSLGTGATWKWYAGSCSGTPLHTGVSYSPSPSATTTYYVRAEGDCGTTSCASVTITVLQNPSTATVGSTQNICGLTSNALGGNSPAVGSGTWSKKSGPGTVSFSEINSGASTATVSAYGQYVFTWTIANAPCNASAADITVNFYQTPTTAYVGSTQNICGLTSNALGGNAPSVGTGAWSKISGTGTATFSAGNSGNSTVTVSQPGAYVFRWTISNGACTSSSADVTVNFGAVIPQASLVAGSFCQSAPNTGTIRLNSSVSGVSYQLKKVSDDSPVGSAKSGGSVLLWDGLGSGSYYVTATGGAPTYCSSRSNNVTIQAFDCEVFYTLTQGYYGGKNGKSCGGNNPVQTIAMLIGDDDIIIGGENRSLRIYEGTASDINKALPGGGNATRLPNGHCIITDNCFKTYLTKNGKIDNVLLSQTITLALNVRWNDGSLKYFPLEAGWLNTQKMTSCGSNANIINDCSVSNATSSFEIKASVVNYLTAHYTATVEGLLALSNAVLDGGLVAGSNGVPSFGDINSAVDAINKGFDEGRRFISYTPTRQTCEELLNYSLARRASSAIVEASADSKISVSAFPNPYTHSVRFMINNPVAGQGSLEVFNTLGQKVKTIHSGYFAVGSQSFELNVAASQRSTLIYVLSLNGKQYTGKLLSAGK